MAYLKTKGPLPEPFAYPLLADVQLQPILKITFY